MLPLAVPLSLARLLGALLVGRLFLPALVAHDALAAAFTRPTNIRLAARFGPLHLALPANHLPPPLVGRYRETTHSPPEGSRHRGKK